MGIWPNRRNKAAFSNFCGVVWAVLTKVKKKSTMIDKDNLHIKWVFLTVTAC